MKLSRRLVLSSREYEALIATLDSSHSPADPASKRAHDRRPFRMADIPLCVNQPDGGKNYFSVYGRNISRGGISILHGGFLYNGSTCRLVLRTPGNELLAVSGVVRHCRHVERLSHEIGIQFLQEINPRQFLLPAAGEPAGALTDAAPGARPIEGTVLVVDGFEPDRRIIEHYLSRMNCRPIGATSSGGAIDAIRTESIDLVISGLDLLGEHGLYLVQRMRQLQFRKPILLALADQHPDNLALVSQAGADDVLLKPLSPDLLAAHLQTRLGRPAAHGALISHVQSRPGMHDLVAQFVDQLRHLARRLRRAYGADDLLAMRELCCRIKGSALSFGYPELTVAALRAVTAIDRHGDRSDARVTVRQLLDACDRVQGPARQAAPSRPAAESTAVDARPAA